MEAPVAQFLPSDNAGLAYDIISKLSAGSRQGIDQKDFFGKWVSSQISVAELNEKVVHHGRGVEGDLRR